MSDAIGIARISLSTARLGTDMLRTTDPPLKLAWVERGNPIPQNPETPTVIDVLSRWLWGGSVPGAGARVPAAAALRSADT